MRKAAITILLLAIGLLQAMAQHTVASIRETYQAVHETISMMSDSFPSEGIPMERYHLDVRQNLPATGLHHESIYMYYGELRDYNEEEEPRIYDRHFLRFATTSYNFAAHQYYEEFLYDEKGKTLFAYFRATDVDVGKYIEYRIYLDGERLLKLNVKATDDMHHDFGGIPATAFRQVYDGANPPDEYLEQIKWSKQKAKQFLNMFKSIEEVTYPYDE